MLLVELLTPGIMILFGITYRKNAPNKISNASGYRTTISMKNRDTWEFAHHYCGKVWLFVGWILLVVSFAAMLSVYGKDTHSVGKFGCVLISAQVVVLLASIAPTEIALRKTFDKDGNRK
jgi:uncharacterized membrane protein